MDETESTGEQAGAAGEERVANAWCVNCQHLIAREGEGWVHMNGEASCGLVAEPAPPVL